MNESSGLQNFLEKIMRIEVVHMDGASAGILGAPDASNDMISQLKKSAIVFATEYKKQTPDQAQLSNDAEQIIGYIHNLRVTSTLSEQTAESLMNDVQALLDTSAS